MNRWSLISWQMINENPWYSYNKDYVIKHDGNCGEYYYVKKKGSSIIIAITDDRFVFIKQYRYLIDRFIPNLSPFMIELPCGGVKENQTFEQAAISELHEETGYHAALVEEIGSFMPYNGISTDLCKVFLARNLDKVCQKLDNTEQIEVMLLSWDDINRMIKKGEIIEGMTLAALNIFEKKIMTTF